MKNESDNLTVLQQIMHDFHCTDPDDMYIKIFADRCRFLKETREGVYQLVTAGKDGTFSGLKTEEERRRFSEQFPEAKYLAREMAKRGDSVSYIAGRMSVDIPTMEAWLKEDDSSDENDSSTT